MNMPNNYYVELVWHGFHDAIREGDEERLTHYWKFLLVIFKASNQYNYVKEAVNLLLQYHYFFSKRQRAELLTSRCVNARVLVECNIPCDLYMEHLNRRLKMVIRNQGGNVRPELIEKAGRCIGIVQHVCETYFQTSQPDIQ